MEEGMWTHGDVEVDVAGLFTTHHYLVAAARDVGTLTLPALSSTGTFRAAAGRELVLERTSWWRGWHELRENGIVVGTARPQGFWRQAMSVGFRGRMYELVLAGCFSRGWRLLDDSGAIVIEIWPRGVFRRGAILNVLGPVHEDLPVFVYYLVNARWQEQTAATAAAAGS
jgi:hypothetical protein